jgi:hypothetical protein
MERHGYKMSELDLRAPVSPKLRPNTYGVWLRRGTLIMELI